MLGILGALSAVGSTVGSIYSANKQNEEARRQFDASLDWSKYQYNDMKQYNSPKNQLRLMREAGLNPALALGQLPSSAAVGSSAPGSTASFTQPDFSGLQSAADIAAQYETRNSQSELNKEGGYKMHEEAENVHIDNITKLNRDMQSLLNMRQEWKKQGKEVGYLDKQISFLQKQLDFEDEHLNWRNQSLQFQAMGFSLENTLRQLEILFKPAEQQAQLRSMASIAYMNYQNGIAAGESANEIKQRTLKELQEMGVIEYESEVSKSKAKKWKNGGFTTKLGMYLMDKFFDAYSIKIAYHDLIS